MGIFWLSLSILLFSIGCVTSKSDDASKSLCKNDATAATSAACETSSKHRAFEKPWPRHSMHRTADRMWDHGEF